MLAGPSVSSFYHYLGNRLKSDSCSYELFCLESHILSFSKVLQIPPESPCMKTTNLLRFIDVCLKYILLQLSGILLEDVEITALDSVISFSLK